MHLSSNRMLNLLDGHVCIFFEDVRIMIILKLTNSEFLVQGTVGGDITPRGSYNYLFLRNTSLSMTHVRPKPYEQPRIHVRRGVSELSIMAVIPDINGLAS